MSFSSTMASVHASLTTRVKRTSETYSLCWAKTRSNCRNGTSKVLPHWHQQGTRSCGSNLRVFERFCSSSPPMRGGTYRQSLWPALVSSGPHWAHHCCTWRMKDMSWRKQPHWGIATQPVSDWARHHAWWRMEWSPFGAMDVMVLWWTLMSAICEFWFSCFWSSWRLESSSQFGPWWQEELDDS